MKNIIVLLFLFVACFTSCKKKTCYNCYFYDTKTSKIFNNHEKCFYTNSEMIEYRKTQGYKYTDTASDKQITVAVFCN